MLFSMIDPRGRNRLPPATASGCTVLRVDPLPNLNGRANNFLIGLKPAIHQIDYSIQKLLHFHLPGRESHQLCRRARF